MVARKKAPKKAAPARASSRGRKAAAPAPVDREEQEVDEVEETAPAKRSKTASKSSKKPVMPATLDSEHKNGNTAEDEEEENEDVDEDEAPAKKLPSKAKAVKGKAKPKPGPKSKTMPKRAANSAGPSTSKRAKNAEEDEDDDEEETEEYEVEKILEIKYMRGGKREFLIKWKGWGMDQTTWEPEEHLQCTELLDAFIAKLDDLKEVSQHELRVARQQTQRYADANRNPGVRTSRRFTSKPRTTYHGLDE